MLLTENHIRLPILLQPCKHSLIWCFNKTRQWLLTFACVRLHWHRLCRIANNPYYTQVPMFDSAASCVAGCCSCAPQMLTRAWHSQALSPGSSARPFIGHLDQIENLSVEWKLRNRDDWRYWKRRLLNKRRLSGFKVASSFCSDIVHMSCSLHVISKVAVHLFTSRKAVDSCFD